MTNHSSYSNAVQCMQLATSSGGATYPRPATFIWYKKKERRSSTNLLECSLRTYAAGNKFKAQHAKHARFVSKCAPPAGDRAVHSKEATALLLPAALAYARQLGTAAQQAKHAQHASSAAQHVPRQESRPSAVQQAGVHLLDKEAAKSSDNCMLVLYESYLMAYLTCKAKSSQGNAHLRSQVMRIWLLSCASAISLSVCLHNSYACVHQGCHGHMTCMRLALDTHKQSDQE